MATQKMIADARQSGGEHQQGLVQAQLFAVARFDAGVLQPSPKTGRRLTDLDAVMMRIRVG
jgi:hypothetical protein